MTGNYWMVTASCEKVREGDASVDTLFNYLILQGYAKYAKVAREIGKNGYEHYQMYICTAKRQRFESLCNLFSAWSGHVERRYGKHTQAKEYIGDLSKSGQIVWVKEYGSDLGISEGSGERSDLSRTDAVLQEIQQAMLDGASDAMLWANPDFFPTMVKYYRGLSAFRVEMARHAYKMRGFRPSESRIKGEQKSIKGGSEKS